ncbi:MAG: MMPL family transporter [Candidatus Heimdallarchaeota archaeon]|nr:MMPL family transporter [Candidatus Heimdallarchaeota archaeon]
MKKPEDEKFKIANKPMEENPNKKGKGKEELFFERLGEFVTNNYKPIVIISLIILGAAVYPAISLLDVMKYNETEFMPKDLAINRGEEILDEQFDGNYSKSSTVIVIDSDLAISSEENMQYLSELTERIFNNYSTIIDEVQSILTVFNQYNDSIWVGLEETETILYQNLISNISTINYELYQTYDLLEKNLNEIATLYQFYWFNFSRTYFFSRYNSSLFDTGPTTSVYQSVIPFTNFTTGFAIPEPYIDYVFNVINTTFSNPYDLNDGLMHEIILDQVNTTLFDSYGNPENYSQTISPLLTSYYLGWLEAFQEQVTNQGKTIINGTYIQKNAYNSSSYPLAYTSQNTVLNQLQLINDTAYPSIKDLLLENTEEYLDLGEEFNGYVNTTILQNLLTQIFDLGREPGQKSIINLAESFTQIIMNGIIYDYNPPETIDDIPKLLSQWVLSSDGKTTLVYVSYNEDNINGTIEAREEAVVQADKEIGELAHNLQKELELQQTRIYQTGEIFIGQSLANFSMEDFSRIDIITVIFVTIVLLLVFCSFIAPLIPLVCIGTAVLVSMAVIRLIAFGMDFHFLAMMLLMVTSFGAGIDYAIFIFSRYDEERNRNGLPKEEAMKISITHAGEAVMHSGLTVMIGFGALIIPNFPLLRCIGIAMIVGISFSIISALIFVPSVILVLGDKIWWPKFLQTLLRPNKWFKKEKKDESTIKAEKQNPDEKQSVPDGKSVYIRKNGRALQTKEKEESFLLRFAHFITKNGLIVFIITLVIFTPFLYFIGTMDTTIDFLSLLPSDFEGGLAKDALSDNTMAFGDPTPTKILIHNMPSSPLDAQALENTERLCIDLVRLEHVTTIRTTVRPLGITIPYTYLPALDVYGSDDFVGKDNRTLVIEVFLDINPYSKEAEHFVADLPDEVGKVIEENGLESFEDSDVYVLGVARQLYELKMVTDKAYPIVVPVVIVGVFLVLFFLFGSYFTPIRLIFTIGISILFTLAMLQLVFAVGFGIYLFWLLPLMLFSILLGLGLDFDIFLVTRVKEYCQLGMDDKEAIAHALDHTATIITSCGLVMAAAYSSLMFSQLWHLRQLGFAFTLSILLDATVIRLIVVPSIMVVMEKWNWVGPKWLQKVRHIKNFNDN